jgi:hypothetical protein
VRIDRRCIAEAAARGRAFDWRCEPVHCVPFVTECIPLT